MLAINFNGLFLDSSAVCKCRLLALQKPFNLTAYLLLYMISKKCSFHSARRKFSGHGLINYHLMYHQLYVLFIQIYVKEALGKLSDIPYFSLSEGLLGERITALKQVSACMKHKVMIELALLLINHD